MATFAPSVFRAKIELKPLLAYTECLFPAYWKHIRQQLEFFDEEDGTQPDAGRYWEFAEDFNDSGTYSGLAPSLWEEGVAEAERQEDPKAAQWRSETPVYTLFHLSSRWGDKATHAVQKAVAWGRSTDTDPSTQAQLDLLKPLTLFENLEYASPTSGSAVLRLDKLQSLTVTALSRYVAHLNDVRSVDFATTEAEKDAVAEASEELSVAGLLQTVLDPARLAEYHGRPVSADYVRKAGQNLLELNEQVGGKARHVVKSLRSLGGTPKGTNASDGSGGDTVFLDLLDFLASGSPGSRSSLFSLEEDL